MSKKDLITVIIILFLVTLGIVYCLVLKQKGKLLEETQLPNPAAVYCEKQGGVLEGRMVEAGQKGFCIFEDGSECGQWEFFRGECQKGERFCKDLCGDEICQEVVCLIVGCPCSETPRSCFQDCK